MGKEMPIGTIRTWSGDQSVIKAHSPLPPYSSGWIPLKVSGKFNAIGRECDKYAADIIVHKLPINGVTFLDHEINTFGETESRGFFKSDNFKQYSGFFGAGQYSFRNEFSKLYMANDMSLAEEIAAALCQANDVKGGDNSHDLLTPEEKKRIRADVRASFKENSDTITEGKAEMLLEIIKRTREQVIEGLNFKDPIKKKAYEDFVTIADSIPGSYELINLKRDQKLKALDIIESNFSDNWGVRESCKDYVQKKFDDYVKKYSDQISKDSLEEQIRVFGVTMDMEPDEFYSKIYAKVKNSNFDFLEKYIGREISIIGLGEQTSRRVKISRSKVGGDDDTLYYEGVDGIQRPLVKRLREGSIKLSPEYSEFGDGFKDLIYLRFLKKYGKSVEGEWLLDHLPAIHNLENIILELPKGHFLTNDDLEIVTNKTYNGGAKGGYAWYSSNERRINLSADCIEKSTVWGVLSNPTEFKSVMLHEIGHAVDKKLGKDKYYGRKKFVVDCGWTYTSPELRAGMSATGDEKDIPRTGSNASVKLITEYAKKSPSEAFAEYYSFYNLNREHFDKFFETGDRKHLQTSSKKIAKSVSSEKTVSQMLFGRTQAVGEFHWVQYKDAVSHLSDKGLEEKIALNSPWQMTLSRDEKKKIDQSNIRKRKDLSINSMPPVIAVRDGLNRHIIDGGVRQEVAKMNKQLLPTIEITKELYHSLKERDLTDKQIADCIYTKNRDSFVPKQIAPEVEIRGLVYRDELIPFDQILENYDVIKSMKEINESKELQKALETMFEK